MVKIIQTSLCKDCGADTEQYGYVNRIPFGGNRTELYVCGGCVAIGYDNDDYRVYFDGDKAVVKGDEVETVTDEYKNVPTAKEYFNGADDWVEKWDEIFHLFSAEVIDEWEDLEMQNNIDAANEMFPWDCNKWIKLIGDYEWKDISFTSVERFMKEQKIPYTIKEGA